MIYFNALRYDIVATCITPLRTGNAEGDMDMILRYSDGTALLQASSIAGALRGWVESRNPMVGNTLFGTQDREGSLILSDGIFSRDTMQNSRPRLRIDRHTGVAADKAKFDVVAVSVGSQFRFTLLWTGNEGEIPTTAEQIESMLSALHSGLILLGAQKTNGFGRVALEVKKRSFHLTRKEDRDAWLRQEEAVEPCPLQEAHEDRYVVFTVRAWTKAILSKSSAPTHFKEGSVTENLYENETPILPGASVKGVIRSGVESIAHQFRLPPDYVNHIFGREARKEPKDNGIAGCIRFSDVKLTPPKKLDRIPRIRINRFTAGVMNKALLTEAPLASELEIMISVPQEEPAACGLILFALRDLGLGLCSLGSGSAIGRGYLTVETITATVPEGETVQMDFAKGAVLSSGTATAQSWMEALGGQKYEN